MNRRVNRHNCHHYATEDPQIVQETRFRCGKAAVWSMIGWEGLLGMRILHVTVNGERDYDILDEIVVPVIKMPNMNTAYSNRIVCLPNYAIAARKILDRDLQKRWVGRRGPIDWPARSLDLTACDREMSTC